MIDIFAKNFKHVKYNFFRNQEHNWIDAVPEIIEPYNITTHKALDNTKIYPAIST
jgi:hypothetical protein